MSSDVCRMMVDILRASFWAALSRPGWGYTAQEERKILKSASCCSLAAWRSRHEALWSMGLWLDPRPL